MVMEHWVQGCQFVSLQYNTACGTCFHMNSLKDFYANYPKEMREARAKTTREYQASLTPEKRKENAKRAAQARWKGKINS